ncbi:hypothetical protein L7F22_064707 [Adiantum nelumboides]|nr:hypothetical protein [Adiantum nelumboides]
MIHEHAFEALDRTLQGIMEKDLLFGGKTMLLRRDFQQVLPVIPKGRCEGIVGASLCNSNMWRHIKVLNLTENMRLINSTTIQIERDFARWMLDIGNGNLQIDAASDDVNILPNMLVEGNFIENIIDHIYGSMPYVDNFADFFKEHGILALKNKEVDMINSLGLRQLGAASKEYLSTDSLCSDENQIHHLYTLEFLTTLDLGGGYPLHVLTLKENAPIMLLHNLDARRGLCDGVRLIL